MTSILRTMRQTGTPLGDLFFSDFNFRVIQNNIRQTILDKSGIAIDYQKQDDVLTLMRMVFINNSTNPYGDLPAQLKIMNDTTVKTAVGQISTGLSQYIGYIRDISTPTVPEPRPIQTSVYGQRM